MNSSRIDASTQISKEVSYKMHIATIKNLYYKKFFESGYLIAINGSPFNIYRLCRLFDECKPDKKLNTKRNVKKINI